LIKVFEDIIAWQKAKHLSVSVYACFDGCKDFGFRDQIQRATVSVMNNIAEGFERKPEKNSGSTSISPKDPAQRYAPCFILPWNSV
jgi:hypothetical protein